MTDPRNTQLNSADTLAVRQNLLLLSKVHLRATK